MKLLKLLLTPPTAWWRAAHELTPLAALKRATNNFKEAACYLLVLALIAAPSPVHRAAKRVLNIAIKHAKRARTIERKNGDA